MTNKSTSKPYVKCIGGSATGVTQSCYLIYFQKYCLMFDCGLYQESDIVTNYRRNQELLKRIKPKEIDWIILHEVHVDHIGLIPALYKNGCNAHLYVPTGSFDFLKILWEDSMKIFTSDAQKIERKHGIKANPFYNQADIEHALNRTIEVESLEEYQVCDSISFTYYPSNHIINAQQIHLDCVDGSIHHRLNFTGDIGGILPQYFCHPRQTLPYANTCLMENTYNQPKRPNKRYDRIKDKEKIVSVLNESKRVLFPCFALNRTQTLLVELYLLWQDKSIPQDIDIYVDSPLAQKFCELWPEDELWHKIKQWDNLHYVKEWADSQALQLSHKPAVVLSASGFLVGGRVVSWLQTILPDRNAHILFSGYSGENNLASQIRSGQPHVMVDGVEVENNANITELVSFSSHASYEELLSYAQEMRYDRIGLIHGDMRFKPVFATTLQTLLHKSGRSDKVICVNDNTKIFF